MEAVIVKADDWQGLYFDDELVYEHHHVRLEDLRDYLPGDIMLSEISEFKFKSWGEEERLFEYLNHNGAFPLTLAQLLQVVDGSISVKGDS